MQDRADPSLLENTKFIHDSDTLWNVCCFEFLTTLLPYFSDTLTGRYPVLKNLEKKIGKPVYNHDVSYGDLYSELMKEMEKIILSNHYRPGDLGEIIQQIYFNQNRSLERTGEIVNEIEKFYSQTSHEFARAIQKRLPDTVSHLTGAINKRTPAKEGGMLKLGTRLFSKKYKPMQITSMPCIRKYEYKNQEIYPVEIRIGTQAQRVEGIPHINPLFLELLKSFQKDRQNGIRAVPKNGIEHLYINNLQRNDKKQKPSGITLNEKSFTNKLEELENEELGLAVVTIPAEDKLLATNNLNPSEDRILTREAMSAIFDIAVESNLAAEKDLHISEKVKKILFGEKNNTHDKEMEESTISQLIMKSFEDFGLIGEESISRAQFTAVYFHFLKFELTDFIIKQLQPQSFNMSCKDGIDRGGASSAYYNLIKSITVGQPLKREEFIAGLHAAAVLVKGRPMNHHIQFIWESINGLIEGQKTRQKPLAIPEWLIEWRDSNKPEYLHPPAHTLNWHLRELNNYIETRSNEKNRFFERKDMKLTAAIKLYTILMGSKGIEMDDEDRDALSEGRLSVIYTAIIKNGFLDVRDIKKDMPVHRQNPHK